MPVTGSVEALEALEPVIDGRALLDVAIHERANCGRLEVGDDLHADPPGAAAAPLDGGEHKRRFATPELATAAQAGLGPANPGVVYLDFACRGSRERLTIARRNLWSISHAVS